MIRLLRVTSLVLAVSSATLCSRGFAATIIGNWESGTSEGWIDWGTGQLPVVPSIIPGRWAIDGVGATLGTKALDFSIAGGSFSQFASIKLQTGDGTAGSDYRPAFLANTRMSFDLTIVGSDVSGNNGESFIDMILNADGWGFNNIGEPTVTPSFPGFDGAHGFDAAMIPPGSSATSTWTYDIGKFHDGNAGNGELNPNPTYIELIMQTFTNNTVKYHIDNVKFFTPVPEPASLALLGLAAPSLLLMVRRRQRVA